MAKKKADVPKARHTLSGQIRDVIESRGLTLAELGKLADVDPTVIGRFLSEEREVRSGTLDKIAAALNVRLVEVAPSRTRAHKSLPSPISSSRRKPKG